jgi:hypothetical protein
MESEVIAMSSVRYRTNCVFLFIQLFGFISPTGYTAGFYCLKALNDFSPLGFANPYINIGPIRIAIKILTLRITSIVPSVPLIVRFGRWPKPT